MDKNPKAQLAVGPRMGMIEVRSRPKAVVLERAFDVHFCHPLISARGVKRLPRYNGYERSFQRQKSAMTQ
jgi:hypothetical protein